MTSIDAALDAPAKLPFWKTIGDAYRAWFHHFGLLVRISWLWILVTLLPLAMVSWMQAPGLMTLMVQLQHGEPVDVSVVTMVWGVIGHLVMLPALSSVAVAWHRLLLLDERPGPGFYLRLDGVVTGYGVIALVLGVIMSAPSWLMGSGPSATMADAAASALMGLLSIVALVVAGRLSLALPARALARADTTPGATLGAAWRMTQGNTARLFFGYLLCILPWSTIFAVFGRSMYAPDLGRGVIALEITLSGLSWMIFGMVSIGFLSVSYRHFAQNHTPRAGNAPLA